MYVLDSTVGAGSCGRLAAVVWAWWNALASRLATVGLTLHNRCLGGVECSPQVWLRGRKGNAFNGMPPAAAAMVAVITGCCCCCCDAAPAPRAARALAVAGWLPRTHTTDQKDMIIFSSSCMSSCIVPTYV